MATTINDAFSAIDDYMAKNGKGQNYLAKKFIDLFEGATSPLNVRSGPLFKLSEKFVTFADSINTVTNTFDALNTKLRILIPAIKISHFGKLETSFDALSDAVDVYRTALGVPSGITFPSFFTSLSSIIPVINNIDKNISRIEHTTAFTKFIVSTMATMMAVSSREKVLPPSGNNNYTKSPRSIQFFSNNTSSNYSPDESTKKGFFGKLFSGIWSITKIVGGVYLLGKLKQYLDDTSTGRAIKGMLSSMFATVLKKITSIVTSEEVWKTLGNSVLLLVDAAGSIADNIFKYVIEPISTKVKQVDWGKVVEYIGNKMNWIYSNILEPIITSISNSMKKDLDNGDWGSLATKVLGTGLLAGVLLKITPGLSSLTGLFTIMSGAIGVPGVAVGVGLLASSALLINRINKLSDMWSENAEQMHDQGIKMQNGAFNITKNIQEYEKRQKKIDADLASMPDGPEKDKLKTNKSIDVARLMVEKARGRAVKAEADYLELAGQSGISSPIITAKAFFSKWDSWFSDIAFEKQSKKFQEVRKTKVQDAEIIIPDKKDSHLFAKGGGPFDVALKDVNKKVDMIISVLSDGFSGLAQITAQSGGAVAQAVVASAGSSKTAPATIIGGSNAIQRHRINTGRHIEFVQ